MYSQRIHVLFCNPLTNVGSNNRSSANIIVFITLSFICMEVTIVDVVDRVVDRIVAHHVTAR